MLLVFRVEMLPRILYQHVNEFRFVVPVLILFKRLAVVRRTPEHLTVPVECGKVSVWLPPDHALHKVGIVFVHAHQTRRGVG